MEQKDRFREMSQPKPNLLNAALYPDSKDKEPRSVYFYTNPMLGDYYNIP